MMRLWLSSLVVFICLSTVASADLKIKTRTTVMGHSTESTVYIKGSRERNEMSFGGHGGAVTILQCDQKRMITISGNQCSIMQMGGSEASCAAVSNLKDMQDGAPAVPRKGGVVTITHTSTDTGERQDMFGYKARHIKSSLMMESTADACNQSHMKMELDGWYADLSAGFACADDSYRALACGAMGKRGCSDRIVTKGGGNAPGYPLKQTTTIATEDGTFTTTTEVVELTNTTLDAPLFDAPPGCKVTDMSALSGSAPATRSSAPVPASEPAAAARPTSAAVPATPAVGPKAAGVVRIGVVRIKDASGQGLPTDSLQLNLMSEFARQQLDTVPLTAETPLAAVESEARSKQCDYFVYTVPTQVKEPGSGGMAPASLPKGITLDPARFQALTAVTLYKVGKPAPELKDFPLAADASQFAVDAVTATFTLESVKVAQQIADDAHPKPAAKPTRTTAKPAASKPKQP